MRAVTTRSVQSRSVVLDGSSASPLNASGRRSLDDDGAVVRAWAIPNRCIQIGKPDARFARSAPQHAETLLALSVSALKLASCGLMLREMLYPFRAGPASDFGMWCAYNEAQARPPSRISGREYPAFEGFSAYSI